MTAVFCANAADRTAATWEGHLRAFDRLEFAVSDAAKGIAKAVADIARARGDDPEAPALEHGLDLFHTAMEAHRVLARHSAWNVSVHESNLRAPHSRLQHAQLPLALAGALWLDAESRNGFLRGLQRRSELRQPAPIYA
jgi:hypothetical protein